MKHLTNIMMFLAALLVMVSIYVAGSFAMDSWKTNTENIATLSYEGSAALDTQIDPNRAYKLIRISMGLDLASATVEDFTVGLKWAHGSTYNSIISTQAMNGQDNAYFEYGDKSMYFTKGDVLDLQWPNTNLRTYGVTVKVQYQ